MSVYGLPSPGGIVVGVDDGRSAHGAVIWAARAAAARDLPLVVCHAYGPRSPRAGHELECAARNRAWRTAQDGVDVARAEAPTVRAEAWVAPGEPAQVLVGAVVAPELVVVGFRARGRLAAGLLATFGARTDLLAPCPVVAVPARMGTPRRRLPGPRGRGDKSGSHPQIVLATTGSRGSAEGADAVRRFAHEEAALSGSRVIEAADLDAMTGAAAEPGPGRNADLAVGLVVVGLVAVGTDVESAPALLRTPGRGRGEPLETPPATTLGAALGYGALRRLGAPVAVVPVASTSGTRAADAPVTAARAGHVAALRR